MTTEVPARLDAIVLGVEDLAVTRAFYENLGWTSRPRDGMFAHFKLNGASLVLFPLEQLAAAIGVAPTRGTGFNGVTPAMLLGSSEELDAVVAIAEKAGGRIVSPPTDRPWGSRTAYVADPENNIWELAFVAPRNA